MVREGVESVSIIRVRLEYQCDIQDDTQTHLIGN